MTAEFDRKTSTSECYQCGGPNGTSLKLCPECVAWNESNRKNLRNVLKIDRSGANDPFFFKLTTLSRSGYYVALLSSATVLIAATAAGLILDLSFPVIFVVLTAAISALVVVVAVLILTVEVARSFRDIGPRALLMLPPMGFIYCMAPGTLDSETDSWGAVRLALLAQVFGLVLLGTSVIAASTVQISLLSPKTYWRKQASNYVPPSDWLSRKIK